MMNSDKLKSIISKKAQGNSDISQQYYQLFYFERILERISKSNYRGQIILKGGLLLTSIIGDDERTTKDMDATLKGIRLSKEDVLKVFEEILKIDVNDDVTFKIISVKDIRLEDEYGGFRLNILSLLGNNKTYVTIELTTGDVITPKEMKYNYNSIFENKKIPIMSYTLETFLAEKFHTIVSRGLLNTRLKDFYDVYIIISTKYNELNENNLADAIKNTFKKRNTNIDIKQFNDIINELAISDDMNYLWQEYALKYSYAKQVKFEDTIKAINKIINILNSKINN